MIITALFQIKQTVFYPLLFATNNHILSSNRVEFFINITIIFNVFNLIFNLVSEKVVDVKRVKYMKQAAIMYIKSLNFYIDVFCIIGLFVVKNIDTLNDVMKRHSKERYNEVRNNEVRNNEYKHPWIEFFLIIKLIQFWNISDGFHYLTQMLTDKKDEESHKLKEYFKTVSYFLYVIIYQILALHIFACLFIAFSI